MFFFFKFYFKFFDVLVVYWFVYFFVDFDENVRFVLVVDGFNDSFCYFWWVGVFEDFRVDEDIVYFYLYY